MVEENRVELTDQQRLEIQGLKDLADAVHRNLSEAYYQDRDERKAEFDRQHALIWDNLETAIEAIRTNK